MTIEKDRLHEIVDFMTGDKMFVANLNWGFGVSCRISKVRINYMLRKVTWWYTEYGVDANGQRVLTDRKGKISRKLAGTRINMNYGEISSVDLYTVGRDGDRLHFNVWRG